jgi:hypothetical protein
MGRGGFFFCIFHFLLFIISLSPFLTLEEGGGGMVSFFSLFFFFHFLLLFVLFVKTLGPLFILIGGRECGFIFHCSLHFLFLKFLVIFLLLILPLEG